MVIFNLFLKISLQKLYNDNTRINWKKKSHRRTQDEIKIIERYFTENDKIIPRIGDIVKIGFKIREGNKERAQYYEGTTISKKNSGINLSYTTRKTSYGVGVERNFLFHSPRVDSLIVKQNSKVRRSKLYFLRLRSGKAARLKRKFYQTIKKSI